MHWELFLHSRSEHAQSQEKTSREQEDAGGYQENRVPGEVRIEVFQRDRKNETDQNDASPEEEFQLSGEKEAYGGFALIPDPVFCEKIDGEYGRFDQDQNLFGANQFVNETKRFSPGEEKSIAQGR